MVVNQINWVEWRKRKVGQFYSRIQVELDGEPNKETQEEIEYIRQYMAKNHLTGEVWNGRYDSDDDYCSDGIDEHYNPEDYLIEWSSTNPDVVEISIEEYMAKIKITTNGKISKDVSVEYQLEDFYDELFFSVGKELGGEL